MLTLLTGLTFLLLLSVARRVLDLKARWRSRVSPALPSGHGSPSSLGYSSAIVPVAAETAILTIRFSADMLDANWLSLDNIHNAYYLKDDCTSYNPRTDKTETTRRGFSLFVAMDRDVKEAHIIVESTKSNARWAELNLTDRSAVLQFQGDYANEMIRATFLSQEIVGSTRRLESGIWRRSDPMVG